MSDFKSTTFVLKIFPRDAPEAVEPLAFLWVERNENFEHDSQGVLKNAAFCISYQQIKLTYPYISKRKTQFHAGYVNTQTGLVSLTSRSVATGGFVVLEDTEFVGHGIGTFLMSKVVEWVKQWPEASVRSVHLDLGQAQIHNKERRNRFYEQLGLVFDYQDWEHNAGTSRHLLAHQLKIVDTWKRNITVLTMPQYLSHVFQEKDRNSQDIQKLNRIVKRLEMENLRAKAKPVWTAIKTLYDRI
jgi:GNAT superfamily N-acetyltransferase